jgi:hypothetical protein
MQVKAVYLEVYIYIFFFVTKQVLSDKPFLRKHIKLVFCLTLIDVWSIRPK